MLLLYGREKKRKERKKEQCRGQRREKRRERRRKREMPNEGAQYRLVVCVLLCHVCPGER